MHVPINNDLASLAFQFFVLYTVPVPNYSTCNEKADRSAKIGKVRAAVLPTDTCGGFVALLD